jgi:hypothetical protein
MSQLRFLADIGELARLKAADQAIWPPVTRK